MKSAKAAAAKSDEELVGEFGNTRWTNPDGTFCIGQLRDGTIVKGPISDDSRLLPGVAYRLIGKWETHPQYGRQFSFSAFVQSEPHTYHGVIEYLLRNTENCGLGRGRAHQLIDLYGPDKAIETLKRNPGVVSGAITGWKIEDVRSAAKQLIDVERFEQTKIDLLDILGSRGFPGEIIEQCVRMFGVMAPRRLRRDPFTLLVRKFAGAGFLRCDRLYLDLGLPPNRLKRQVICAWHLLRNESFESGSTWHPEGWLKQKVGEMVSGRVDFEKAMRCALLARWIVRREDAKGVWLATAEEGGAERNVDLFLRQLLEEKGGAA